MRTFTTFCLLILCSLSLSAQGSWFPANADTTYPRGLLKASDRNMVQTRLVDSPYLDLFIGIYNDAQSSYPNNSSNSNKRRRARIAKNAAFCAYLNRGVSSGNIVALSATDSILLTQKARTILESLDPTVASPFNYLDWQWDAKIIVDYLYAYDLLKGAGLPNDSLTLIRSRLQMIVGNLYTGLTFSQSGLSVINLVRNNHLLMPMAAVGAGGVILNDVQSPMVAMQPQAWANLTPIVINSLMFESSARLSEPDSMAGYYEGPYYWKYAFLSMNKYFRPMKHFLPDTTITYTSPVTGNQFAVRHPFYDPRYKRVNDWIANIMMPDGRMPALEDSFIDVGFPDLAVLEDASILTPMYYDELDPTQRNTLSKQINVTVDMRADFVCSYVDSMTANPPLFWASPSSGDLVFRSASKDPQALYMHLTGKNGLARIMCDGHNQADETSFIVYAYGRVMAMDPGYLSYAMRDSVGNAWNHSMILVDGAGPAIGVPGTAGGADAFIENSFNTPNLDGGDVRTSYQNNNFVRSSLFVRNRYFLIHDRIAGITSHTYTHQIHGAGLEATGGFTPDYANQQVTYSFGDEHLRCVVAGDGGALSYSSDSSMHELNYQDIAYHTVLHTEMTATDPAFLSVLYPYKDGEEPAITLLNDSIADAFMLEADGYKDVLFVQNQNENVSLSADSTQLATDIVSDASMALVSSDSLSQLNQLHLAGFTNFQMGDSIGITSSSVVTFVWQLDEASEAFETYNGYISGGTVIRMRLPFRLGVVSGNGVLSSYDVNTGEEVITFTQSTIFSVQRVSGFLPVEGLVLSGEKLGAAVELVWQTETESETQFFVVEKSLDGRMFTAAGEVAAVGESQNASLYTFQDPYPFPQTSYYRVRLQFTDGSSAYSNIIQIQTNSFTTYQVFPNPANDVLNVTISSSSTSPVRFELLDELGKKVIEDRWEGNGLHQLDISWLPQGAYIYRIIQDSQIKTALILRQ